MDDNGDAEGNYTLIGLMEGSKSSDSFGLFPMGTLTRKQHNDSALPVRNILFYMAKFIVLNREPIFGEIFRVYQW